MAFFCGNEGESGFIGMADGIDFVLASAVGYDTVFISD